MASTPSGSSAAFELKGRMAALTVVRVLVPDVDALIAQLGSTLQEAPRLLRGAPMALDLDKVDGDGIDLQRLAEEMRAVGVVPVAVQGHSIAPERARAAGLGILSTEAHGETAQQAASPQREPATASQAPVPAARVLDGPVRSGQQVYARGSDLVVLGAVGPGAEVLADGDIHIYGVLRGRALAGLHGNAEASIFCLELEAELVSVAGDYQVNEHFDAGVVGRSARIRFDDQAGLCIEAFGNS